MKLGRARLDLKKIVFVLLTLLFLLSLAFLLSIGTGAAHTGFLNALLSLFYPERYNESAVVLTVRFPRFLIGAVAGWSLCLSGAVFQGILRNPLADSYVLGVASGSAFGAVLERALGLELYFSGMPLFGIVFSILTVILVYYIARVDGKLNTGRMILSGVIVGTFFSACVSFVLSVVPFGKLHTVVFWLLGDLSVQDTQTTLKILPYIIAGSVPALLFSTRLNILSLGEEGAEQLGVNVRKTLTIFFLSASLLTASVVSVCGVIGFIGLIVPHMIRIILGPDHRLLLPASGLAGATVLVLSDILARALLAPAELPIGAVTAFLGTPFFLYLLKWRR